MIATVSMLLALALGAPAGAQISPVTAAPAAPDYGGPAAWACRPDAPGACAADLDAMKVSGDGMRTPDPFKPAADPAIDCFYVYPTASGQPGDYADPVREASVDKVIRSQAARLASRCRVFAPLYRQLTSAGLDRAIAAGRGSDKTIWITPYLDVRAAWRSYLAHDNHGRGVVLIGHSQGSILLAALIARDIEGAPAQKLVVSAILAGHPGVLVPTGAVVGGTFKSMPLCHAKAQSGCVVAWSTYPAGASTTARIFARDQDGMSAACVNPAALGGGSAPLHPLLSRPSFAPGSDPPYVEPVGQLVGACAPDGGGTVLQVSVLPGRYADIMTAMLTHAVHSPGWGLHSLDVAMVETDILDLIPAQAAAWSAAQR